MNPTDLTYQAEHAVVNLRVGRYEEAIQILNNILRLILNMVRLTVYWDFARYS